MDVSMQLIIDGRRLHVMPDTYTRMVDAHGTIPDEVIDAVRKLSKMRDSIPTGCAFCAFREQRESHKCHIPDEVSNALGVSCGEQNLVYVDPSELDAYNVAKTLLGAQS